MFRVQDESTVARSLFRDLESGEAGVLPRMGLSLAAAAGLAAAMMLLLFSFDQLLRNASPPTYLRDEHAAVALLVPGANRRIDGEFTLSRVFFLGCLQPQLGAVGISLHLGTFSPAGRDFQNVAVPGDNEIAGELLGTDFLGTKCPEVIHVRVHGLIGRAIEHLLGHAGLEHEVDDIDIQIPEPTARGIGEGELVVVFIAIHDEREAVLPHLAGAGCLPGLLADSAQRRHENPHQHGNDGDDDE